MIIVQLNSEQLSSLIQNAVREAIGEPSHYITTESDQLLTIQEAGQFLKLTVPTLYGYVSRIEIPFSKKGKRLYFSKKELTDWVKTGRKRTVAEISAEANTYLKKKGA